MVNFTEIITASIEWTATMLFKPFKFKKWLLLTFIAFMAGHIIAVRVNFNIPYQKDWYQQKSSTHQRNILSMEEDTGSPLEDIKNDFKDILQKIKEPVFITIIMVSILIIIAIVIIFTWLWARFTFVFLEDVVHNDALIKAPFHNHKDIAHSLFLFSLLLSVVFLFFLGPIIFALIYRVLKLFTIYKTTNIGFLKILFSVLPFLLVFLLFLLIFIIIQVIINDFVVVVMFKNRAKIMEALKKTIAMIRSHKADTIVYILTKAGLGICTVILYTIVFLVVFLGLLLPAGIIRGLLYLSYRLIPVELHFIFFIFTTILIVGLLLLCWYFFLCLNLPFAIFFRTLSIKFMARLEPNYNLFRFPLEREAS